MSVSSVPIAVKGEEGTPIYMGYIGVFKHFGLGLACRCQSVTSCNLTGGKLKANKLVRGSVGRGRRGEGVSCTVHGN